MDTADGGKAARAREFLYRYMWARRRCVGAAAPGNRLAQLIEWGSREFDGIDIDLNADPPVVRDSLYPAFFLAMLREDDTAMPETEAVGEWREYVLYNGPLPKRPGPPPAFPIRTRRRGAAADAAAYGVAGRLDDAG